MIDNFKKGRIYCIHYGHNINVTQHFLFSLKRIPGDNLQLVIVNNSKEVSLAALESENVAIINSDKNRGYFGAFKFALEKYPLDDVDYVIVCNNDVEFVNDVFFEVLNQKLQKYDIIAPSVKTLDNIEQNPHRETSPSLFRKYYYFFYFSCYCFAVFMNNIISLKKKYKKGNPVKNENERKIFSAHGACIIFNRSYFERGGKIDAGYFLYGEEDSVAAQADILGLKIGFVPHLKIKHSESVSTGKRFSKNKYRFQKKAYRYIKNKYPNYFHL